MKDSKICHARHRDTKSRSELSDCEPFCETRVRLFWERRKAPKLFQPKPFGNSSPPPLAFEADLARRHCEMKKEVLFVGFSSGGALGAPEGW